MHTGLGIVQAIAALNTSLTAQYGVQLAVRLGIHTGPAVAGGVAGGTSTWHLGETPTSQHASKLLPRPTRWSLAL